MWASRKWRFYPYIRNMITEESRPGLAPGEVKDFAHNPSAVSLLADKGPDAHPLRARLQKKPCVLFGLVMWFPSGH